MPTATVGAAAEPLAAAVARRSPRVAAALDGEQARTTAHAWADRAHPGALVETVTVGSVRYRPDGGCTLRYRLRLAERSGERVLFVTVPAAAGGTDVRAFPDDPELPTLARAADPVHMRRVLGRVLPGTGGDRAVGRCAVDVVSHPRRSRCVLRYRLMPGSGGAGELRHPLVFGKVHADDTASAAAASLRLLRAGLRLLPAELRFGVPQPLAVVPDLRLGLVTPVPGRPVLPELLAAAGRAGTQPPRHELEVAVATAARVVAAVHAVPLPPSRLPVRDLARERQLTEAALAELEPVWPDVARRLRAGVARAADGGADLDGPAPAPVLAHGDLTPGQVLVDDSGGAALVDVDTTCAAEPALDLGRFLAYLHVGGVLRSVDRQLLDRLTTVFLSCHRELTARSGDRRAPEARIAAHRALALGRLGASACWQLKDHRLRAVLDVLEAGDVLDAGDGWTGRGTR